MNREETHILDVETGEQYVNFVLGKEFYAIDVMRVESIERVTEITPVPKTPNYVLGIINIRGDIVPVICLRRRLAMEEIEHSEDARIIITRFSGYRVGILVDKVEDVYTLDHHKIQTGEDIFKAGKGDLISGVIEHSGKYVLVLDLPEVIEVELQGG